MTHTPGPWKAKQLQNGDWVVLREDRSKPGLRTRRVDDRGAFAESDARLIAAAPDLLAALEDLAERYQAFREFWAKDDIDKRSSPSIDRARAAIANAKGEPDA